jgi:hypothetical protein
VVTPAPSSISQVSAASLSSLRDDAPTRPRALPEYVAMTTARMVVHVL